MGGYRGVEEAGNDLRHISVCFDTRPDRGSGADRAGSGRARAILDRIGRNYGVLAQAVDAAVPSTSCCLPTAGWSAVLRMPSTLGEEQLVVELLEEDDVLVHPGYFFDFPHEAFLIVSLLPPPDSFDEGVRRSMNRLHV